MGKKIIILNGSPRKSGNTFALIATFTKGAEEAGNTVTTFFLDDMNIYGCKGCFGGGKNPANTCVQKDDMDKIYPVYKEAELLCWHRLFITGHSADRSEQLSTVCLR